MSELTIKDGSGTGYRAKVDTHNRLLVKSAATTESALVSDRDGLAFTLPIMNYPLGTPAEEYELLWFKNTDPDRHFHINRYYLSWNGGDTNHNRACDVRLYVGMAQPSANYVDFSPGNLNLTSPRVALAEAKLWNGVGSGMTVASLGTKAQAAYLGQGATQFDIDGTFIIGYGQIIGVTATPEEAGKLSMIISGWYSTTGE